MHSDAGTDVEMRPLTNEGVVGTATESVPRFGRHRRHSSDAHNGGNPRKEKHWWDAAGFATPSKSTTVYETGQ